MLRRLTLTSHLLPKSVHYQVLGLMFNAHDRQSPFDLPLSEAPTTDVSYNLPILLRV